MPSETLNFDQIKTDLRGYVGQRIMVRANKGRKRIVERRGTLENTYPDLFLVRLGEDQHNRSISYTYADVLTKDVEVSLLDEEDNPQVLFEVI